MTKRFDVQNNIGKAKYVVSFFDGEKKHTDGSDFFDVAIFRDKKKMKRFLAGLRLNEYIEKP